MKSPNYVVYVFVEQGRDEVVKIGRCRGGGWTRFQAGSYVNPRQLDVVAMWKMADLDSMKYGEALALSLFEPLAGASGREWRHASPEQAIERISVHLGPPDFDKTNMPFSVEEYYRTKVNDDLRERGSRYNGRLVQQRFWIHEEQGGPFRKIGHNTWWCEVSKKTSNRKSIAHNTLRLEPVACYAVDVDEHARDWEKQVEAANLRTIGFYPKVVDAFGIKDRPTGRAGWTLEPLAKIRKFLEAEGFVSIPLDRDPPPRGIKSLTYRGR